MDWITWLYQVKYFDRTYYDDREDFDPPRIIRPRVQVVAATIKRTLGRKREQEEDPARLSHIITEKDDCK